MSLRLFEIVQSNWYEIFWLWQKWWMDKIISGKTNTLISSFYESWDYTLENFKRNNERLMIYR